MKMFQPKLLFLYIVLLFAASCKKTEDIKIPGNIPPPDHSIDSSTINIYINKAYINIVGREPLASEKSSALVILKQNNFSIDNRKQFIQTLLALPEHNKNLYSIARHEYLGNNDDSDITQQIFVFQHILTDPNYVSFYPQIQFEKARLDTLLVSLADMNSGSLDYRGLLRRCVNNYFYDQLNMGTENFVVSTFQNFFFRYPNQFELTQAKTMIDGQNSTVFFQAGKTKNDYLGIFFTTNDYYEGQVRFLFKKYLFREPTSAEISFYAAIYKNGNNYRNLELEIFSMNEYAGIQ